jgi:hypothetical protein
VRCERRGTGWEADDRNGEGTRFANPDRVFHAFSISQISRVNCREVLAARGQGPQKNHLPNFPKEQSLSHSNAWGGIMRSINILAASTILALAACGNSNSTTGSGGGSGGGSATTASYTSIGFNNNFTTASNGSILSFDPSGFGAIEKDSTTYGRTTIAGLQSQFDGFRNGTDEDYAIRLAMTDGSYVLLTRDLANLNRATTTRMTTTQASYTGDYFGLYGEADDPEATDFVIGDVTLNLDVTGGYVSGTISNRMAQGSVAMGDVTLSSTSVLDGVFRGNTTGGAKNRRQRAIGVV